MKDYSTLLIKARSNMPSNDNHLPVQVVASSIGDRKERKEFDISHREKSKRKYRKASLKTSEPVYHSDNSFSISFLNSNPKLEDTLMKKEK